MENSAILGGGIIVFIIFIVLIILAILWFLLPFAVFGIKDKLDKIIASLKKTNDSINSLIETLAIKEKSKN
jgi:hypothetical protein